MRTIAAAIALLAMVQQTRQPPRDVVRTNTQELAALSGRVTDDRGDPVGGAMVVVAGGSGAPGARTTLTREDGGYEIAGIPPGLYTLGVSKLGYPSFWYGRMRPGGPGAVIEFARGERKALAMVMPRGAVIAGMLVDQAGEPSTGYVSVVRDGATTGVRASTGMTSVNTRGEFRAFGLPAGTYRISGGLPSPRGATPDDSGAISLTVRPGEERGGVVIHARPPAPTTLVTVAPSIADGTALRSYQVKLRRVGDARETSSVSHPNADGTRTVSDVPAGSYTVVVRADPYIGAADVTVDGEHAVTVPVSLSRGVHVRGTVSFADASTAALPRFVSLSVAPADSAGPLDDNNTISARLDAAGRFDLNGVPPGRYVFRLYSPAEQGLTIDAVILDGKDITDVAFTAAREDIDGVQVSLTRSKTMLRGTVKDPDGHPLNGVAVLAFPIDPKYRIRNSRRVAFGHTSVRGEYEIATLPPGTYGLAIVDDVDYQLVRDPAFIATLRAASTVTLAAGETKTHPFVAPR